MYPKFLRVVILFLNFSNFKAITYLLIVLNVIKELLITLSLLLILFF